MNDWSDIRLIHARSRDPHAMSLIRAVFKVTAFVGVGMAGRAARPLPAQCNALSQDVYCAALERRATAPSAENRY